MPFTRRVSIKYKVYIFLIRMISRVDLAMNAGISKTIEAKELILAMEILEILTLITLKPV